MSRSYKKNMGDTWACGSDKYSRSMYQRSFRRRANRYCHQVKDNYEIEQIFKAVEDLPTDHIVNGIDYSCRFADKWSWASDGGTFIKETEASLKQQFDKELFGLVSDWRHSAQNVWERYNDALSSKSLWTYYFVELIVYKNIPKRHFDNCDDLVLWMRENQKWLLSLWKRINYGK